jgi:hypothetical protein
MMGVSKMLEVCSLSLLLILGAQLISTSSGSSRDVRSFSYTVDRSSLGQELQIQFDPFLQNFEDSVLQVCSNHLSCKVDTIQDFVKALSADYSDQVNENIVKIFERCFFATTKGSFHASSRYSWLDQADEQTVKEANDIRTSSGRLWEVLQKGLSTPNNAQLTRIATELEIQDFLHPRSTADDLLDAASRLFNMNYYEHSFAVATYLFWQQEEYSGKIIFQPPTVSNVTFKLDTSTQLALFPLLAELFQLNNNVEGTIAFYAKTLLLLSNQIIFSSDSNGLPTGQPVRGMHSLSAYLARVRVVLFMPILPDSFALALKHRAHMIEDIEALTTSLLANNVDVSIQVSFRVTE